MGWLRNRFGETNTAIGAALIYTALRAAFPVHAAVLDAVAGALGVGFVVTPKAL